MESKWFVDENVKNIDKEILLCFPYAGASINMFSMWKEYIDKVIVCPVKLPFRDARRKEKLPESVQKLAEVFVKENIDIMRKRYSIFGHCTGAILGYEIARQTYEKTGNEPTVIIASSSQEPAIIPKEAILLAGASDSEIQAYLETERLVDKSILEMPEFQEYYFPILRADFRLFASYHASYHKFNSVDVIPSLDGTGAEYYFTDLSAFFLNNAREKFSGYEWVKYNIFDINKDIMEQTIAPFSVDIILAANVLHNAKNIHYVLENLKKLLKPNGTIIILEETLEAYTLLTSMEFKDGLTGFTDERAENNQTFFKREQWEGVFKEHKADIVYQFPEKGTPLEMAGQTIYVVRFKENYICPDKNNMLDELERRIPEYMIPSVITFLPRLPQTSNDKIDRGRISKWISASAEENKKVDVAELPQNDLEEQIARIWCKELNIERIGRNDNFYLSGGDSLLIAQVIARMRETIEAAKRWSWDDLLKEMMKTPTIRGVAKILSNQAGENEQDKSLVIIKEAAESSEKKVTVVFHAGTGTLTPYNSLIAYITERSQENEAVMGFTFGDEAEYLAIPTDKIFENLGKKYGRILSELGFTEYTLIGHCVGGLIALETAHYLKDKGKNVSSVTLLSTSIPHKKEETVLADLDMKIFETAVQTSLYNELLLERTFASLIDADIKKAGHQVDNDTLQQVIEYLIFNNGGNITVQALCSLTGKFAEVGAEFQRLHSMSATERMNDLYTTIERPNGQLMEHQRKMLNVLFRVFAQNFRCVSSYIPKVYTGKMRVFDCESAIANFFPSLFSEDKKTWEQYAQGEFLFDTMKGDHISCMNSPYIEENVKKILDL